MWRAIVLGWRQALQRCAGRLFEGDARGGAIIDAGKPLPGERIVGNPYPIGLGKPDLMRRLERLGRAERHRRVNDKHLRHSTARGTRADPLGG
ncbi:MAG TPA: hypothetical protein VLL28_14105 [Hyphomicrobiaceae bacterium]|nr:hypothetical protein [Hyphomicrobiaceae bacterium]